MPNCCPVELKPVESNYKKKDNEMYITGTGPVGIIIIQDIFGNHPSVYALCDTIASLGYTVIKPDMFKEEGGWPAADFPPKDGFEGAAWMEFYGRMNKWDDHVATIKAAADMLARLGVKSFGAMGMCFGAKVALKAQALGIITGPVVGVHPSSVGGEDGENATAPVLLLPSADENKDDMKAFEDAINKKPFAEKCSVVFFDDLRHGFLGARGHAPEASDYSNPTTANRAAVALKTAMDFFAANL